jgi:hypothetical protein
MIQDQIDACKANFFDKKEKNAKKEKDADGKLIDVPESCAIDFTTGEGQHTRTLFNGHQDNGEEGDCTNEAQFYL